jgi:hypothetical protein
MAIISRSIGDELEPLWVQLGMGSDFLEDFGERC